MDSSESESRELKIWQSLITEILKLKLPLEEQVTQKVVAFKRNLAQDFDGASKPADGSSKKFRDLLSGTGDDDVVEGRPPPPPRPVVRREVFSKGRPKSYVDRAKQMELNQKNAEAFFNEPGLVEQFGVGQVFKVRLGQNGSGNNIFKLLKTLVLLPFSVKLIFFFFGSTENLCIQRQW